jgi:hypothetical protein
MNNLLLPAYPIHTEAGHYNGHADFDGFTKLELASLMIAQGLVSNPKFGNHENDDIGEDSVRVAKAVLEEANK